jgi:acyl carrier protein
MKKPARPIRKETLPTELRTLVATVLDRDESEIRPDVNLIQELGVDSIMFLEVLVVLERTYGIKTSQEDLKRVTCLNDMCEVLLERAQAASGSVTP